jgi:hypothetical protein
MVSRAMSSVVPISLGLVLGLVVGSAATLGSARQTPRQVDPASMITQPREGVEPAETAVDPDFQAAGGTSEMLYVPVPPCRLVDTRVAGGKLAAGALRNFKARGTGSLASQGGSTTGCALPTNAASLSVTVVGVAPAKAGYLRSWAFSTTEPLSSFMNLSKGVTLAGFTNQDLAQPSSLFDFSVRNRAGALHLVVDVSGYYIAPLIAQVNANGTLARGSRVVSAVHSGTGQYRLYFDRDVTACSFQVTTRATGVVAKAIATAEPSLGEATAVFVLIGNDVPAVVDVAFTLTVTC